VGKGGPETVTHTETFQNVATAKIGGAEIIVETLIVVKYDVKKSPDQYRRILRDLYLRGHISKEVLENAS
jgi:hypothetical protein